MNKITKTILIYFTTASILILLKSKSLASLIEFFSSPFSSTYSFFSMLDYFSLLLIASCSSFWSLSTNHYNLGGEGQIYTGGFITAIILGTINPSHFSFLFLFITLICAMLICGSIMLLTAILYDKKNVNTLLSSFIISLLLIIIIDSLISNSFRDTNTNLLTTITISKQFQFKHFFEPASFNISFLIAIFIFLTTIYFFTKTKHGFNFLLTGKAREFSLFRGINVKKIDYLSMTISGALNGMCGFFAIVGTYYSCHQNFYLGLGWNAFTIALLSYTSPKIIISVTLLFAYFFSATNNAIITNIIPTGATNILQAVLLLMLAISNRKEKN